MGVINKSEFDDITKDGNGQEWSQICSKCVTKKGIKESTLDDAGSGICGIKGCSNESDYYIDFK